MLALLTITSITYLASAAYGFADTLLGGQVLYYTIINDGPIVTNPAQPHFHWQGHTKPTGNLVISDNVTYGGITYSVVAIGNKVLYECTDLTSINIPDTVTVIHQYAFACSGLPFAVIDAHNIENAAFYNCQNLTSITLDNSVTSIRDDAFRATGLPSVTIPCNVSAFGTRASGRGGRNVLSDRRSLIHRHTSRDGLQHPFLHRSSNGRRAGDMIVLSNSSLCGGGHMMQLKRASSSCMGKIIMISDQKQNN